MKIISCKIENFGKLSNAYFDFTDGLNIVLGENGFGKSTLATFIRVMFYGFEKNRVRNDIMNERKRYTPWQGGAFGGSITFEANGKHYIATRFFKSKEADDEFELRDADTNLISFDFSDRLGEELFNINSESFANTVYIEQNNVPAFKATDDINAKLGNISDGIDLNRFAKAEEWFKDYANSMSPTRKTGEIARMKSEASLLKASIQRGSGLDATISSIEERIRAGKAEIEELKEKISKNNEKKKLASEYEKLLSIKKTYDSLYEDILRNEELLNNRKAFFKKEIPSKAIIEEWEKTVLEIRKLSTLLSANSLSESEKNIYEGLLPIFREGVPDEKELDEYISLSESVEAVNIETARYSLTDEEKDKLNYYNSVFDFNDACMEVNHAQDELELLGRAKAEADTLEANINAKTYDCGQARKKKTLFLLAGIVSVALCTSGLFLEKPFGIAVILIGMVLAIACISIAVREKILINKYIEQIKADTDKYAKVSESNARCENDIRRLFERHGFVYDEYNAMKVLRDIFSMAVEANSIREKAGKYETISNTSVVNERIKKIESYLANFNIYSSASDYKSRLVDLRGKSKHFVTLVSKVSAYETAKSKVSNMEASLINQLLYYDITPGTDIPATVDNLLDIYAEYESILEIYNHSYNQFEAFKKDNDMENVILKLNASDVNSLSELIKDYDDLSDELEKKQNSLMADIRILDGYNESYEEWCEKKEELSALEGKIKEKTDEYAITNKAWDYLVKARENLTSRYMEPLLTGFGKYYGVLTGRSAQEFKIDANTVITKEEAGKQRSTLSLSAGWQDLIGFCFRLAMADAMYKEEKPMLIMDDPFVNLDDKRTTGAKKLLDMVSKEYQILYLTCREDRL